MPICSLFYILLLLSGDIHPNPGPASCILDHPLTVVLNVFWHWKATGLKVSRFMGIQNQEEHIGHVKQSKSDRYRARKFLSQA